MTRLFLANNLGNPSDSFAFELQEPTIPARAVGTKPKLIVLDEPMSDLRADQKLVLPLYKINDTTTQVSASQSSIWTDHNVNDAGVMRQALFPKDSDLDLGIDRSQRLEHAFAGVESDRLLGIAIYSQFVGEDGRDSLLDHHACPRREGDNRADLLEARIERDTIEGDTCVDIFLFVEGVDIVRLIDFGVELDLLDFSNHLGASSLDDFTTTRVRGNFWIQDSSGERIVLDSSIESTSVNSDVIAFSGN
ncbi:MAG: hypothetical protein AAGB19_19790 [Cyanobacteria bacterium P01_F01_bin.3]